MVAKHVDEVHDSACTQKVSQVEWKDLPRSCPPAFDGDLESPPAGVLAYTPDRQENLRVVRHAIRSRAAGSVCAGAAVLQLRDRGPVSRGAGPGQARKPVLMDHVTGK